MRNPLWLVTSGLAVILLLLLSTVFFLRKRPQARKSLAPVHITTFPKKSMIPIDLSRIYENDLFRTYRKPLKPIEPEKVSLVPPSAPPPVQAPRIQPPRVTFLEPLKINLKGIITSTDEKDNRAIVADEKTKKEEIYAVGDILEDAEIIRIQHDKVIFVRSNGQQETLFLRTREAAMDPLFTRPTSWQGVVQKISEWSYAVDPTALQSRVVSLAQFIDMLDMTTVFDQGASIGCRIGAMTQESIGPKLGLRLGDIITHIQGMPVSSTQQRVLVYQFLKDMPLDQSIRVRVLRRGQQHELVYVLKLLDAQENATEDQPAEPKQPNFASFNQLSPMVPEMQKRDQAALRNFGGRSALLERI